MFVQYSYQDLDRIGILQNLQKRRIHRKMLNGFQHLDEIIRFKQFACSHEAYFYINIEYSGNANIEDIHLRRTTILVPSALRT